MAYPILVATERCFGKMQEMADTGHLKAIKRIFIASILLDMSLLISGVVLGALGMVHIIPMPGIAAYSLFSLSGAVALAWMISAAATRGQMVKNVVTSMRKALDCRPKSKYIIIT